MGINFYQCFAVFDLLIYLAEQFFSFIDLLVKLVYLLLVLFSIKIFIVLPGFLFQLNFFMQQLALSAIINWHAYIKSKTSAEIFSRLYKISVVAAIGKNARLRFITII